MNSIYQGSSLGTHFLTHSQMELGTFNPNPSPLRQRGRGSHAVVDTSSQAMYVCVCVIDVCVPAFLCLCACFYARFLVFRQSRLVLLVLQRPMCAYQLFCVCVLACLLDFLFSGRADWFCLCCSVRCVRTSLSLFVCLLLCSISCFPAEQAGSACAAVSDVCVPAFLCLCDCFFARFLVFRQSRLVLLVLQCPMCAYQPISVCVLASMLDFLFSGRAGWFCLCCSLRCVRTSLSLFVCLLLCSISCFPAADWFCLCCSVRCVRTSLSLFVCLLLCSISCFPAEQTGSACAAVSDVCVPAYLCLFACFYARFLVFRQSRLVLLVLQCPMCAYQLFCACVIASLLDFLFSGKADWFCLCCSVRCVRTSFSVFVCLLLCSISCFPAEQTGSACAAVSDVCVPAFLCLCACLFARFLVFRQSRLVLLVLQSPMCAYQLISVCVLASMLDFLFSGSGLVLLVLQCPIYAYLFFCVCVLACLLDFLFSGRADWFCLCCSVRCVRTSFSLFVCLLVCSISCFPAEQHGSALSTRGHSPAGNLSSIWLRMCFITPVGFKGH